VLGSPVWIHQKQLESKESDFEGCWGPKHRTLSFVLFCDTPRVSPIIFIRVNAYLYFYLLTIQIGGVIMGDSPRTPKTVFTLSAFIEGENAVKPSTIKVLALVRIGERDGEGQPEGFHVKILRVKN
jgi:hypothetical protein